MAVYLALALLPTPIVVSWFLTRPAPASETFEKEPKAKRGPSLTDLARPQPRLAASREDSPALRLARQGPPVGPTPETQGHAEFAERFSNAKQAREAQLADLTAKLGDRGQAEKLAARLESSFQRTPKLFAPRRSPPVPALLEPLPAQTDPSRRPR